MSFRLNSEIEDTKIKSQVIQFNNLIDNSGGTCVDEGKDEQKTFEKTIMSDNKDTFKSIDESEELLLNHS